MTHYRVSFYKHLLSSDGHPFRCLQQSVKIGNARSIERAVLAAKHRFERREGLRVWDLHADDFDVEIGEPGVSYVPSHSASAAPSGASCLDLVGPIAAGDAPDLARDLGHVPRDVQGPRIQAHA